jgi:hypothetical protein
MKFFVANIDKLKCNKLYITWLFLEIKIYKWKLLLLTRHLPGVAYRISHDSSCNCEVPSVTGSSSNCGWFQGCTSPDPNNINKAPQNMYTAAEIMKI